MLKKLAGLPNSWMRMQNSDSRCGDMQNCGSVIADCGSQAGQWTHTTPLQFAECVAGYLKNICFLQHGFFYASSLMHYFWLLLLTKSGGLAKLSNLYGLHAPPIELWLWLLSHFFLLIVTLPLLFVYCVYVCTICDWLGKLRNIVNGLTW